MPQIAAFIDFQGTLGGTGLDDIRTLDLYPCATPAVARLNAAGVLAIGVTNQSHIGKGLLSMEEYEAELARVKGGLAAGGAHLDDVYCCPHATTQPCACKKPSPAMVYQAAQAWDIDLKNSYVIGDMGGSDMVMGSRAGTKKILVLTGVGQGSLGDFRHMWADIEPDYVAQDLLDAVKWLLTDAVLP